MRTAEAPLVTLREVSKTFTKRQSWTDVVLRHPPLALKAVDLVSFSIPRGETVGLVGESGSGKSTLARCIVRLYQPDCGEIEYEGVDIASLTRVELIPYRRKVQMVFQDPYSSLNPRLSVESTLEEVLIAHHICPPEERSPRVTRLLDRVGLHASIAARFPGELSGGQRQRVGIARALAVEPQFLIADEPVSALDVSIQAQIINLLQQIQHDLNLTMLFISHDLRVIRHISNQVFVMYLGRILESGPTGTFFQGALHPYSKALLAAAPKLDERNYRPGSSALQGETPSPYHIPSGCRFHTRCPYVMEACRQVEPALIEVGPDHQVACHLYPTPGER